MARMMGEKRSKEVGRDRCAVEKPSPLARHLCSPSPWIESRLLLVRLGRQLTGGRVGISRAEGLQLAVVIIL
jgi:hypothetical protein